MNYDQAIDYILNRLPAFERDGVTSYKPGLERITAFCDYLGNPQNTYKTIHIAGTNGKGSTCHILAAILQSAGYKTGLHISPHFRKFTERARVNGQPAPDDALGSFIVQHRHKIEEIGLSYFELSTGFAFYHFAQQRVDIAVIETGLGGTYDATNIIHPIASLITNISNDHLHILGPTLRDVAGEKAGIIKPNTPVIISQSQPDFADIFTDKAAALHSPVTFADTRYTVYDNGMRNYKRDVTINCDDAPSLGHVSCDLVGNYQRHNIPGVLSMVDVLRENGFAISDDAVRNGFEHCCTLTGFKGRWQILNDAPLTIADGAHNEAGIAEALHHLSTLPHRKYIAILGCVNTKNPHDFISVWPRHTHFIFSQAAIARAMPAQHLADTALALGYSAETIPNINEAYAHAQGLAKKDDLIFLGGSLYLLAECDAL